MRKRSPRSLRVGPGHTARELQRLNSNLDHLSLKPMCLSVFRSVFRLIPSISVPLQLRVKERIGIVSLAVERV